MPRSTKPTTFMPDTPVDCPYCYNAPGDIQKKCTICHGKTICTYRKALDAIETEQDQPWTEEHTEGLKRAISLMMLDPYRVALLFMDETNVSHAAYNLFQSYDVDRDALEEFSPDKAQFNDALKYKYWCKINNKDKKQDDLLWQRTHRLEWKNFQALVRQD